MTAAQKKSSKPAERVVAQNRAAGYRYELLERFEAGMALNGTEVKSLREGRCNLRDAHAEVRRGEVWLENCHIGQFPAGGPWNHDPLRPRKLLLQRREIEKLAGRTQQKGMTLVPLRIYFRKGLAKCELALARGKKVYDRRRDEREREAKREASEALYQYRRRS